jgi:NADH:ubiquinone oxidoreductase subunit F (NADH-binding)
MSPAPPPLTLHACAGLPCRLAGGQSLAAQLPALLGPGLGISPTECLGRCDHAPAVLVGEVAVPQATTEAVLNAVVQQQGDVEDGTDLSDGARDFTGYDAYRAGGGYSTAAAVINGELGDDVVFDTLEQSGLATATRSQPGGGLVTARWRELHAQPGPRALVLNLAPPGPGQCKERELIEREPHRVLEGALIAAHLAGAGSVYITLRDDYHAARELLAGELDRLQAQPPCRLPHIELWTAAGGYVGGESSAVLETLQGAVALPRSDAALVTPQLFGQPVLVEQLEGVWWAREILERGAKWFASQGRRGRKGLRLVGVSGRVRRPGAQLVPAGITLRELIEDHCGGMAEGHELYAWLPGGAAGGILPAHLADVPLDFNTLQPYGAALGPGAIIVLGQDDRARDAALEIMRFVAAASCGQCTPCRVGSARAAKLMEAPRWDADTLDDLAEMIHDTSICGVGRAAALPARCIQRYFRHEVA